MLLSKVVVVCRCMLSIAVRANDAKCLVSVHSIPPSLTKLSALYIVMYSFTTEPEQLDCCLGIHKV